MIRVGIDAVELRGPGLADWTASQQILANQQTYHAEPVVLDAPQHLSPAERRRAIPSVRLALALGAAVVARSGHDPETFPAVFASSGADSETNSAILLALMAPGREISPTRFHNSVHNAPSGYWGVAMQSREAVTSLSGHDASFAAGLLEASVQAVHGGCPVLFIAYDLPYPHPLDSARRIEGSFGVGLALNPAASDHRLAELQINMISAPGGPETKCTDPGLEHLRRGNPAARSLPLLAILAAGAAGQVRLGFNQTALEIGVAPC